MRATALIFTALLALWGTAGAFVSEVWVADRSDGTYFNPVINADYSDPDAKIKVSARSAGQQSGSKWPANNCIW